LVKIAVELQSAPALIGVDGTPNLARRPLAQGNGWSVADVLCSAGPRVRSSEEQHSTVTIAIVRSGSFQYQSSTGRELMIPGSLMLGNAGQYFQCGHEHGAGDKCISFAYTPQFIEELAAEAGVQTRTMLFSSLRIPPVRELSNIVSRAFAGLPQSNPSRTNDERVRSWEEMAVELAILALELSSPSSRVANSPAAEWRVTKAVRVIESRQPEHDLLSLAREAGLSRYHFLRIFRQLTGLTPHQYVLRSRLRHAATRLLTEPTRVLDVALDSGFGDVSNFNHAFRAEFAMSPRLFRVGQTTRSAEYPISLATIR
jgi:AraC-like DNA-binding protein